MNHDERKKWLDSLKVGDEVCYDTSAYNSRYYKILKIEKITPKRYFVLENMHFKVNPQGRYRSDVWHSLQIEPVTEEIRIRVHRLAIIRQITSYNMNWLDYDDLKKIEQIIEKTKNKLGGKS